MTGVRELMAAGVNVAFGHDCVMDLLYGVRIDYMLEVAHMGLHVAKMTSQKGIRASSDAVTTNAAKVIHLKGYRPRWGVMRVLCCCSRGILLKRFGCGRIG